VIIRTLVIISILSTILFAQFETDLIQNIYSRHTTTLNGKWHYIVDMYENGFYDYRYQQKDQKKYPGSEAFFMNKKPEKRWEKEEYDFDLSPVMNIHGDWNSQNDMLFYYEGTIWFKKSFNYKKSSETNRVFIHFGAVNYQADVYLNGKKLGRHIGGFTPFNYEVTDIIKAEDNFIVVKVDNKRKKEAVPTLNTDWWNYGGITRDVTIVETPATYINDYWIQIKRDNPNLFSGYIHMDGEDSANHTVTLFIPELKINKSYTTDDSGKVVIEISADNIKYWWPQSPKLYNIIIKSLNDMVEDKIGFRTIAVKGTDILLNGKPIFLRGISIHEENPMRGARAYSREDAVTLVGWAKELGCNFVRLAHYPHNENMVRYAEETGIMVWEEIPVYWTISWESSATYKNAEDQLKSMIERDKNRAAVIIWSMANETPIHDARLKFLKGLTSAARKMDNTRLISAALEKHYVHGKENTITVDDPFVENVDLLSFNEYIGWYDGLPEKASKIKWDIKQDKPVFISEFGGGALQGFHGDKLTIWSEEFQEELYIETIKMMKRLPQLRGMSPWILTDFRSPRRLLPVIQDGWNRKGLISEMGEKKKAFFILQKFYQEMNENWSE
jgi:beta-glucuronidase